MLFCDGFLGILRLIPSGDAENLKTTILVFVVGCDEVGNLLATRSAPGCPEIYEHILTLAYLVAETGRLALVFYGEVGILVALLRCMCL